MKVSLFTVYTVEVIIENVLSCVL